MNETFAYIKYTFGKDDYNKQLVKDWNVLARRYDNPSLPSKREIGKKEKIELEIDIELADSFNRHRIVDILAFGHTYGLIDSKVLYDVECHLDIMKKNVEELQHEIGIFLSFIEENKI